MANPTLQGAGQTVSETDQSQEHGSAVSAYVHTLLTEGHHGIGQEVSAFARAQHGAQSGSPEPDHTNQMETASTLASQSVHQPEGTQDQSGPTLNQASTLSSSLPAHAEAPQVDLSEHASFDFSQMSAFVDNLKATIHDAVDQHQTDLSTLVGQFEHQLPELVGDLSDIRVSIGDLAHHQHYLFL